MSGCRRFLHVLLAWLAIVAYVTPAAAHSVPGAHTHANAGVSHGCSGHEEPVSHTSMHVSATPEVAATDADGACGDHKAGSVGCCVAMCAPALPSPALIALWTPVLHASSDRPIADGIVAAFITRLDRPPKSRVAPIG